MKLLAEFLRVSRSNPSKAHSVTSRVFVYNAASFRGPVSLIGPRMLLLFAKVACGPALSGTDEWSARVRGRLKRAAGGELAANVMR